VFSLAPFSRAARPFYLQSSSTTITAATTLSLNDCLINLASTTSNSSSSSNNRRRRANPYCTIPFTYPAIAKAIAEENLFQKHK